MRIIPKTFYACLSVLIVTTFSASCAEKAGQVRKPLPSAAEIAKLPRDGGAEFNRLVHETSPYLMQHARNPVDWYPWGEVAFAAAKKANKPIFLSVGYSSCHWCHVMEHESFEDEDVAKIMNANYICVKVDREERPDVDQIYMTATHLITRRGGWPNSVWLTPDSRPFYAGTYFPKPQYIQVLEGLANAWKTKRGEVEGQADKIAQHIKESMESAEMRKPQPINYDVLESAVDTFRRSFDEKLGGFGKAPKFPPHAKLRFLLTQYNETRDETMLPMITHTLDQMALGGIHDHIGGGFHRYATDAKWFLPHFEKMLYDNGQLAWVYTEAYRLTKKPLYKKTLVRMFEWIEREMTHASGGFYSALDADSEGEEAIYYIWTMKELEEILGKKNGTRFAEIYNSTTAGNYFDQASGKASGANIPHLDDLISAYAEENKIDPAVLEKAVEEDREKLLAVRMKRIPPGLDDKILTAWNGLMISGMAHAGQHLDEPRYVQAAEKSADFIMANLRKNGRLLRSYRSGQARLNAYLDDYAFLADGMLDLYKVTKNKKWLDSAEALIATMIDYYQDGNNGGFFFTAHDHEELLARNLEPFDNATPSGNAVAIRAITRLAKLTGKPSYYKLAETNLKMFGALVERVPSASGTLLETLILFRKIPKPAEAATAKSDAQAQKDPVTLDLFTSALKGTPGSEIDLLLRITIDKTWHINANKPLQDYLVPTDLKLTNSPSFVLSDVVYPKPKLAKLAGLPEDMSIYEGTIDIRAKVKISDQAKTGTSGITLLVDSQACDDEKCLRPETHTLKVPIEIATKIEKREKRHPAIFN